MKLYPAVRRRFIGRIFLYRTFLRLISLAIALLLVPAMAHAGTRTHLTFERTVPIQYIAALGDPNANSGSGAQFWGLWRVDPGPTGLRLGSYKQLKASGGAMPAHLKFDSKEWWLEENGLLMKKPDFPLPPGNYLVTGARSVTTVLTVYPRSADGTQRWELANGAKLYDVTHLPCRSARYTPMSGANSCSPARVQQTAFPVKPGSEMPAVKGCHKQDYAVLFVIGVAVGN